MKQPIVFATTNKSKMRVFQYAWENAGLADHYNLKTLSDFSKIDFPDIHEDSGSFAGDALLKAEVYANILNLPCIAQDRGFIFDALNWPGTLSKETFTGDQHMKYTEANTWEQKYELFVSNAQKILKRIEGEDRTMTVVQGMALSVPGEESITEEVHTKGIDHTEIVANIDGPGMFDWFFIPDGFGFSEPMSCQGTQDEVDLFEAEHFYPISPQILVKLKDYSKV